MTEITVTRNGVTETHEVKSVEDRNNDGEEYWMVNSIQPSETRIIESSLTWLSGSMADPRDYDSEESLFPCVYIPKDSNYEVDVHE